MKSFHLAIATAPWHREQLQPFRHCRIGTALLQQHSHSIFDIRRSAALQYLHFQYLCPEASQGLQRFSRSLRQVAHIHIGMPENSKERDLPVNF